MRTSIILVLASSAIAACSGSLDVVISSDAGSDAAVVDASVDSPVDSEPACTDLAASYITVESIGGGGAPVLMAGGWLFWGGSYALWGTPLGPTANPVKVFDHDDVYQSLASDGTTLFFSTPTLIGSLPIGSTSVTTSTSLGGSGSIAVDAQHLFWVDWAGTHLNSMDKTMIASGTAQSLNVNVPTTDAGALSLTGLSLTSNSLIVSMDGNNIEQWQVGNVISIDKSGGNTRPIGNDGAIGVSADDTTAAWVNPIGWTVDIAPVAGGSTTHTTAAASYLAENATAFFSSGPMGLYRINKSDGKVTQLSGQSAGRVAAGNQCLYFYHYGATTTEIQIVAVGE